MYKEEKMHIYMRCNRLGIHISGKAETMIQMARNMIEYTGMLTYGNNGNNEDSGDRIRQSTVCAWVIVHMQGRFTTAAAD
jgi:hypothetical protein